MPQRRSSRSWPWLGRIAAMVCISVSAAPAKAQSFNEFPIPTADSGSEGLALGLDGNLWFTEFGANKIGVVTPAGTITEFALPTNPQGQTTGPLIILRAPDGALWFTMAAVNKIGRITTAGITSFFTTPTTSTGPQGISVGPDGNIWFTESEANKIGRLTLSGTFTEFPVPTAHSQLERINVGPDGNLWFTEQQANKIGRITPSGVVTEFAVPTANSGPFSIRGFGNSIWFTEVNAGKIAQANSSGQILQEIPTPAVNSQPASLILGPDGHLWFTEVSNIGRVTNNNTITEFSVPAVGGQPTTLAVGADGAFWFTADANNIERFLPLSSPIQLFAAVLPSSRSPQVGGTPATAFATIINAGSSTATACAIAPVSFVPAIFDYQTTNPSTNALTGTVNTPVDIAAGASQSFVFAEAPTASFPSTFVELGFICSNANAAPIEFGLDTLLYSASTTPVPDVVALAATPPPNNGILSITGVLGTNGCPGCGLNAFAVATFNVGSSGTVTATAVASPPTLPLALTICQTNPRTGVCVGGPGGQGPSATVTVNPNDTPTFAIFGAASGVIPFVPQTNRIFVEFSDATGTMRGSTSVAVETQ